LFTLTEVPPRTCPRT